MAHVILLKKKEKSTENLALVVAHEIWRFHGIPSDIVSDWDAQFTSNILKAFLMAIDVKPQIWTAFHSETDGQTKRVNQTIKDLLRAFVYREVSDL
jgi:hypothetical protein